MARKPVSPESLLDEHLSVFNITINNEPPLACVLIAATLVENALMSVLNQFLTKCTTSENMFKDGGILGDPFKCANMAYALGLISKPMKKNLEAMGTIRNLFAHSKSSIDFKNKEVAKLISETLTYPETIPATLRYTEPRAKFCQICSLLFGPLICQARDTKMLSKQPQQLWPEPTS